MKINHLLLMAFCFAFAVSCGKKTETETDTAEIAEEQNEEKFDSTKIEDDTEFAVKAADAGMLEVKLGELAQTNASNAAVKKFGQDMIADHGKANTEFATLAQQKNISIPAALSDDSQKTYDDLAKKTGADFDKAYCDLMVKDHKDVVDLFKDEAENGKDAEIKSWAAQKIPALEHHLTMAEETEKAVKK